MAGDPDGIDDSGNWIWAILSIMVIIALGYMSFNAGMDNPESMADLCNDTATQLCESKGMVMVGVYDRLMQRVYVECKSELEIAEYRINTDSCGKDDGD